MPALTSLTALLDLRLTVDRSTRGMLVKLASRLIALTQVRVGVLRAATWDEFDGIDWSCPDAPCTRPIWRIPSERMKLEVEDKGNAAFMPGGGITLDGTRWISLRPAFLLPVRALGTPFRRLFLTRLIQLHRTSKLTFFGSIASLAHKPTFHRHLPPVRKKGEWFMLNRPLWSRGRTGLSLALHPSGCDLEPTLGRVRPSERHVPL